MQEPHTFCFNSRKKDRDLLGAISFFHTKFFLEIYFSNTLLVMSGALIFNDTLWPELNTSSLQTLNVTQFQELFNSSAPYGSRVNPNWSLFNKTLTTVVDSSTGQGIFSPVTLLFNTTSDHALPALIQELTEARLKTNLNDSSATLKVFSHPLPLTKTESLELQTVLTVLAALFVLIPFCYLGASYAVFIVRERVVKAKLLQVLVLLSTIRSSSLPFHYCSGQAKRFRLRV